MLKPSLFAFIALLAIPSWSRNLEEVVIPIDFAVGPAVHTLPGALSDGQTFLPGIALDVFAVVTPDVIKNNKDRIPKTWRKLISPDQELHIRPWYLTLLPSSFLIHPGNNHAAYAATVSLFGIYWNNQPIHATEFSLGVKLPTITYAWIQSPQIEEGDRKFLGLGIAPRASFLWKITDQVQLSVSWDENLYLPIQTTEYTPLDRSKVNWTFHGVGSCLVHIRIPTIQKI